MWKANIQTTMPVGNPYRHYTRFDYSFDGLLDHLKGLKSMMGANATIISVVIEESPN